MRSAIKQIEKCKIDQQELLLTQKNVFILKSRLDEKDSAINQLEKKDSINQVRYSNSLIQIGTLTERVESQKKINEIYKGINKTEKKVYAGVGFVAGVLVMLATIVIIKI